jgi:hypoxanthine phosphoribosyltransferase
MKSTELSDQLRKVIYSWADVDRLNRALAERLRQRRHSIDVIVAIARGGCVPAVHLSHLLAVRSFEVIHLQTTSSDAVAAARKPPAVVSRPSPSSILGKHVLLVDDVLNTGATMTVAAAILQAEDPRSLTSCALVWDRLAPEGTTLSVAHCDFWIDEVVTWVELPWNN